MDFNMKAFRLFSNWQLHLIWVAVILAVLDNDLYCFNEPFILHAVAPATKIFGGYGSHYCAYFDDSGGTLKCWGQNNYGQLGYGNTNNYGSYAGSMGSNLPAVSVGDIVLDAQIGYLHTCALLNSRGVKCWGQCTYGQCGTSSTSNLSSPPSSLISISSSNTARSIAVGTYFNCVVNTSDQIKCWGYNYYGSLAQGTTSTLYVPSNVAYDSFGSGLAITKVNAGGFHACALLSNGEARCWGYNDYGQLGIGNVNHMGDNSGETFSNLPKVLTPSSRTVINLAVSFYSSCFILSNNAVGCYGIGGSGQLGQGSTNSLTGSPTFTEAFINAGANTVTSINGGGNHFCAVLSNGKVKCWGINTSGQLGVGSTLNYGDDAGELLSNTESSTPAFIHSNFLSPSESGVTVTQLATSQSSTCVFLSNGRIKCFGGNAYGQLGIESTTQYGDAPTTVGASLIPVYFYPTSSPTKAPTTLSPTFKPTATPTTGTPTRTPTTGTPTRDPTLRPTANPTTARPTTKVPTVNSPTTLPTTTSPTRKPTNKPSVSPTKAPTATPTVRPTKSPSESPTRSPTKRPTASPSKRPTLAPTTRAPTFSPSTSPTASPTVVLYGISFSCTNFPFGNCPIGATRIQTKLCQCLFCPVGTYKLSASDTTCTACGNPGVYCPSKTSGPITVTAGQCTFWDDLHNVGASSAVSKTYKITNPYKEYTDLFTNVFVGTATESLSAQVGTEAWPIQRYGGLRLLRTNATTCGSLSVDKTTSTLKGVIPSPVYDTFVLTNNGGLPVNVTISLPAYARFILTSTYTQLPSPYVLEPGAVVPIELEIATKSIAEEDLKSVDADNFYIDFTITMNWKQYWSQTLSGTDAQGTPIVINVHADLRTGSLVVSPENIDIIVDADSTKNRSLILYNIQAQAQNWTVLPIEYLTTGYSNWASFPLSDDGTLQSSCNCVDDGVNCVASTTSTGDLYKTQLTLKFDSHGLASGNYQAKVTVSSPTSSLSVPISMTVNAGEAVPSKTTWRFSDVGSVDGTLRVKNVISIEVIPRDQFDTKTFVAPNDMNIEDLYFTLSWYMTSGVCPPTYNGGACIGFKTISYSDQGWISQIQFPAKGTYGLNITMNGQASISNTPLLGNVVKSVDCASYDLDSEPGQYGDTCECIIGYGVVATSGTYVSCDKCKAGFYDNGADKCLECPLGQYQDETGKTSCKICSSKALQPSEDKASCQQCEAGMVVNATGDGSSFCQKCPEGTYAPLGATECVKCSSPAYYALEGASTCSPCPAGSLVKPGDTKCTKCPVGYYTTIDNPECRLCPSADLQPNADQNKCEPCPAGSVVNAQNTSTPLCQKCPDGMVAAKGDTECKYCDSLAYEPNSDQSSCVACPAGKVVNARGTDKYKCQLCPEGYYAPSGSTECRRCLSNALQPTEDHSECIQCPPGTVVNATGDGTLICQACLAGYIVPIGGEQCKRCQSRIFEPNEAATACIPCDQDRLVPVNDDKWVCRPCDSDRIVRIDTSTDMEGDYYCACHPTKMTVTLSDGSDVCKPCPEGGFCAYRNKNNLLPLHGYWQLPWEKSMFIKCRNGNSCPGVVVNNAAELLDDKLMAERIANYSLTVAGSTLTGGTSELECAGEQLCNEGYTGPLCVKCEIGYTRVGDSGCQRCISREVMIFVIIIGFGFAISITIYIIRRTIIAAHLNSDEVMYMKILASHLQMISICSTFRLEWPVYIIQFYNVMDLISSAGQTLLSLDCLLDSRSYQQNPCPSSSNISSIEAMKTGIFDESRVLTFYTEAGIIAIVPLIWCVATGIFWYAAYKRWQKVNLKNKGRSFFNFFIISNIVVLFLLYPTLTRAALKFLSCSYEDMDGVRFLEADFNIRCWGPNHLSWVFTVGLLMLIIYAIGIPLGSLYFIRKHVGKESKYKEIYSFAFAGYKNETYFWEIVIMMRKFIFAFIAVVLRPYGRKVQGYTGLLLLVICLELQAMYKPYLHSHLNIMEMLAIFVSFFTIYFGLFNASKDILKTGAGPTILSIAVLVINLGFLVYILVHLYRVTFLKKTSTPSSILQIKDEPQEFEFTNDGKEVIRPIAKSKGALEQFFETRQNSARSMRLVNAEEKRMSKKNLEDFFAVQQQPTLEKSVSINLTEDRKSKRKSRKADSKEDNEASSKISSDNKDSPMMKGKSPYTSPYASPISSPFVTEKDNNEFEVSVIPTILGSPLVQNPEKKKPSTPVSKTQQQ